MSSREQLADRLRRQWWAENVGDDIDPIPWKMLKESEQRRWLAEAERAQG